jgi:adenosylhomocysteine nucleosidase
MTRTAIIAAMPGELKPFVHRWPHESHHGVDLWRRCHDRDEWVAACAGAGANAATRAFAEVEKNGAADRVISTGWAGALSAEFASGKAYAITGVIDAENGERFVADSFALSPKSQNRKLMQPGLWLVTSSKVADQQEKQRLAASYHAGLVDMEAAAVARLARMRGIPFYCIKGVSDGLGDELPDFNHFVLPDGRFRLVSFIGFVLLRPRYWKSLMRMGENSKKAAKKIAESLLDFMNEEIL